MKETKENKYMEEIKKQQEEIYMLQAKYLRLVEIYSHKKKNVHGVFK